jgi:hypothetical protein
MIAGLWLGVELRRLVLVLVSGRRLRGRRHLHGLLLLGHHVRELGHFWWRLERFLFLDLAVRVHPLFLLRIPDDLGAR